LPNITIQPAVFLLLLAIQHQIVSHGYAPCMAEPGNFHPNILHPSLRDCDSPGTLLFIAVADYCRLTGLTDKQGRLIGRHRPAGGPYIKG
jgi:hypothetical protein